MAYRRNKNQMAPYFVQMREYERKLLLAAIEAAGGLDGAAAVLGMTRHYVRARARWLGGVLEGDPKHEPPGGTRRAWSGTFPERKRRLAKQPSGDDGGQVDA